MKVTKLLLALPDIQEALGCGKDRAREIAGDLPRVRLGKFVRYPASALEDWVATHTER
jgi:predicted DNA-binding transcriptional regulator AlpA